MIEISLGLSISFPCSENSDTEDKLVESIVLIIPIQLQYVPLLQLHRLGSKEEVMSESIRVSLAVISLRHEIEKGVTEEKTRIIRFSLLQLNSLGSKEEGMSKRGQFPPFWPSPHQGPIQECCSLVLTKTCSQEPRPHSTRDKPLMRWKHFHSHQ